MNGYGPQRQSDGVGSHPTARMHGTDGLSAKLSLGGGIPWGQTYWVYPQSISGRNQHHGFIWGLWVLFFYKLRFSVLFSRGLHGFVRYPLRMKVLAGICWLPSPSTVVDNASLFDG